MKISTLSGRSSAISSNTDNHLPDNNSNTIIIDCNRFKNSTETTNNLTNWSFMDRYLSERRLFDTEYNQSNINYNNNHSIGNKYDRRRHSSRESAKSNCSSSLN